MHYFFSDLKQLLIHVPKNKRKVATQLLDQIDLHPNEVTFDSSGIISIDGTGIPSSNVFLVFPLLFKKTKSILPGLEELKIKLSEMHLDNLIEENVARKKIKLESKVGEGSVIIPNKRWYFLGP